MSAGDTSSCDSVAEMKRSSGAGRRMARGHWPVKHGHILMCTIRKKPENSTEKNDCNTVPGLKHALRLDCYRPQRSCAASDVFEYRTMIISMPESISFRKRSTHSA